MEQSVCHLARRAPHPVTAGPAVRRGRLPVVFTARPRARPAGRISRCLYNGHVETRNGGGGWALPFLAGVAAGTAGIALLRALERKQVIDPSLFRTLPAKGAAAPV